MVISSQKFFTRVQSCSAVPFFCPSRGAESLSSAATGVGQVGLCFLSTCQGVPKGAASPRITQRTPVEPSASSHCSCARGRFSGELHLQQAAARCQS